MAPIPNLDKMRSTMRETNRIVERMERIEKRNKKLNIARQVVGAVIIALIILPIKVEEPSIWHGVISWTAIAAFFVVSFLTWRQKAPLTRWRNVRSKAAAAAFAMLIIPLVVMLFNGWNPEKLDFYYLMWGGAVLFAVLYVVGRVMYRRVKAETEDEVERIRRREQRRKKMELL